MDSKGTTPVGDDDFDATAQPYERLLWHIAKKSFQLGGVVGRSTAAIASSLVFAGSSYKVATIQERVGVEDRAYRLHHNASQNRTDLFSGVGAVAGTVAALFFARARRPLALLGAAAVGSTTGIAVHVATSTTTEAQ